MKIKSLVIVSLLMGGVVALTPGCASSSKSTKQADPLHAFQGHTANGTETYISGWQGFTNETGAVQVYPVYSAIINTNKPAFSLKALFFGDDGRDLAFSDVPFEQHKGGAHALLDDAALQSLDSTFVSGSRFGGNSSLTMNGATVTVNTNGITAAGNAASQLVTAVGSAVGTAAGKTVSTAVTGK